jgi:hypothetical protein
MKRPCALIDAEAGVYPHFEKEHSSSLASLAHLPVVVILSNRLLASGSISSGPILCGYEDVCHVKRRLVSPCREFNC